MTAAPVVITGTSTGIGAASALLLAEKGFRVFAGVRNEADGDALVARSSGELTPVRIDITDEASISAAVDTVEGAVGERGLFGLVNNAGIVKPGPLELQPMADFRRQLEVNLIGQVAVTQAFLPLIRRGKGRIVNVGSIGGHLVLPLHGAYSASKFGMEAVSDASAARAPAMGHPGFAHRPRRDRDRHLRQDARGNRRDQQDASASKRTPSTTGRSRASGPGREDGGRRGAGRGPFQDRGQGTHGEEAEVALPGRHGAEAAVALARTATDGMKDRAVAHEAHLPAPE